MTKIIIDVDPQQELNIVYGLGVIKNLGLHNDFLYGIVQPYAVIPESDVEAIEAFKGLIYDKVASRVPTTVLNRRQVIDYYVQIIETCLAKPLRECVLIWCVNSRTPLEYISFVNIKDIGNGVMVGLTLQFIQEPSAHYY